MKKTIKQSEPPVKIKILPKSGAVAKVRQNSSNGSTQVFENAIGLTVHDSSDFARWGERNTEPLEFTTLGVNNSIIPALLQKKASLIVPSMPVVYVEDVDEETNEPIVKFVNSPEIRTWLNRIEALDMLRSNATYLCWSENTFTQLIFNRFNSNSPAKIVDMVPLDYTLCEISKDRKTLRFYKDWRSRHRGGSKSKDTKSDDYTDYEALSCKEAFARMENLQKGVEGLTSFVIHNKTVMPGSSWYGQPVWSSGAPWISFVNAIPVFKNAQIENAHNIQWQITYYKDFATEYLEDRENPDTGSLYTEEEIGKWEEKFWEDLDNSLSGAVNTGKSFRTGVPMSHTGKAGERVLEKWFLIEAIPNNLEYDAYSEDMEQGNKQITQGINLHINTTSVKDGSGMNSGSDQKTAFNTQEIERSYYRDLTLKPLEVAMYISFPESFEKNWRLGYQVPRLVNDDKQPSGVTKNEVQQ